MQSAKKTKTYTIDEACKTIDEIMENDLASITTDINDAITNSNIVQSPQAKYGFAFVFIALDALLSYNIVILQKAVDRLQQESTDKKIDTYLTKGNYLLRWIKDLRLILKENKFLDDSKYDGKSAQKQIAEIRKQMNDAINKIEKWRM